MNEHLPRPVHVVIANYSGYIAGDDAIFESLIAMVRRALGPTVEIDALTGCPERTLERYPVGAAVHVYQFLASEQSLWQTAEMLARTDLLIIGGGDIIEGQRSFAVLTALARAFGVPVAFVGVGVLDPGTPHRRALLRRAVSRARYLAVRDIASTQLLAKLGVRHPNTYVVPDLASALECDASSEFPSALLDAGVPEDRPFVVVNLRAPDTAQYEASWGEAEYATLAARCRVLIDEDQLDVVCVPLVSRAAHPHMAPDDPTDDEVLMSFTQRIGRAERVHVLRGDYRPSEIVAILRRARYAVGMRLHFLLLSALAGTPPIAVSYASKVREFMDSAGLGDFCVDMPNLDGAALAAALSAAQDQYLHIGVDLARWQAVSAAKLKAVELEIKALAHIGGPWRRAHRTLARPVVTLALHAILLLWRVRKLKK